MRTRHQIKERHVFLKRRSVKYESQVDYAVVQSVLSSVSFLRGFRKTGKVRCSIRKREEKQYITHTLKVYKK